MTSERVFVLLAVAIPALASDPNPEAVLKKIFDANPPSTKEQCAVTPVRPTFDFSLRFQTGFALDVPAGESITSHRYVVALRITPESGPPAYFLSRVETSRVYGSFELGPGRYKVDMLLGDSRHEVCRGQWNVEAKPDPGEHRLQSTGDLGKLTILMNVMPPSPGVSKLPENDERKMLGALYALLTRLHAESVRVVVFDLEQQRVLLTKNKFTAEDVQEVAKVINDAQFGLVNYATLSHPKGAAELLAQLTEQEQGKLRDSDALVFLGSEGGGRTSMPSGLVKKLQDGPHIFYLDCVNPPSIADRRREEVAFSITAEAPSAPVQPAANYFDDPSTEDQPSVINNPITSPMRNDLIEQLVKHLKGQIIAIRTPNDCTRAIQRIMPRP